MTKREEKPFKMEKKKNAITSNFQEKSFKNK